jgi:hypothetical protein
MEVIASCSKFFIPSSQWIWGWVNPMSNLDVVVKRKIPATAAGD